MNVTISEKVKTVKPDFEVGTLYQYQTDGEDIYVVLVTGKGHKCNTYRLFSGTVVYAHSSTGRVVGETGNSFTTGSFKPFKGTLSMVVE